VEEGGSVFLGTMLGALLVLGAMALTLEWGAERIKTASLPVNPPLIFVPK